MRTKKPDVMKTKEVDVVKGKEVDAAKEKEENVLDTMTEKWMKLERKTLKQREAA